MSETIVVEEELKERLEQLCYKYVKRVQQVQELETEVKDLEKLWGDAIEANREMRTIIINDYSLDIAKQNWPNLFGKA